MMRRLMDWLVPAAFAATGSRYSGTIGDYTIEAGYQSDGDTLKFDGKLGRDSDGVKIDVDVNGDLSGFELDGGVAVSNGRASNINLTFSNLTGEVTLQARGGRGAKAGHKGESILKLPLEYEWPVVIDGIPFVLKLAVALLLNEGFTSVDAVAGVGVKLKFNGATGFDMKLPGLPAQAQTTAQGEMNYELSIERADGTGLGPQTLLVACQFPRFGFGLGFGQAYAGSFIDIVTATSTTVAGATALVPCQRGQLVVTGSVGVESAFLLWERSTKVEVYRKEIVRTVPDVKACRIEGPTLPTS